MTTIERVTTLLRDELEDVSRRVLGHVPNSTCNIRKHQRGTTVHLCASFLASQDAETLDLCAEVSPRGSSGQIAVDLVVGGAGDVLAEIGPILFDWADKELSLPNDVLEFLAQIHDQITSYLIGAADPGSGHV